MHTGFHYTFKESAYFGYLITENEGYVIVTFPGPDVIKLFPCSSQLSTKFHLLIKTKIPTNKAVSCFNQHQK